MIKISKQNNSLIVEGIDNVFYPNNGDNSYPLNSLIVVTDNSDMATFRSVATNDVLFSGLIEDITINGEAVTKDNIITKFDAVSNSTSTGGGGGSVDAYTKTESDAKYATKDELTAVETVANDADTKADAATSRIESVETTMGNKQDTLVSGTNIKTVNSQSILGSGDLTISGVSEEQAQEIAKIPTLETEIAQKANVSDVPTVQNRPQGTRINYIYSSGNMISTDNSVVSNIKNSKADADTLNLEIYNWGGGIGRALKLPSATTTAAGVMSAADKTKLDSIPETIPSQSEIDGIAANVSALESDMANKQPILVSGTNIKTINNQSILGEGNIEITGGDVDLTNYYTKTEADEIFATTTQVNHQAADISALQTDMRGKQATLVSGENIKTINSQSILGSGDLTISGVSDEQAQEIAKIPTIESELAQKANVSDIPTVQTGRRGTNKNYVYSDADTSKNNDKVLSYCYFFEQSPNRLEIAFVYWGDEGVRLQLPVPLATPSTAGIMSGGDKTKLDSIPETIPSQSEIDGIAANVSALQTAMDGKQPTLVSGTNIKTINGNSILGEGNLVIEGGGIDLSNYYTKTETDTKLDTKQNTLVSGTNIKTINGENVLGEGNIVIEGSGITEEQAQEIAKIPTLETSLNNKQDTLVSGTNIKTVNSQSILGEGNIEVTIPDATTATSGAMSAADKTKLDSISNEWTGTQAEYDALTTKDNNTIYYVTE